MADRCLGKRARVEDPRVPLLAARSGSLPAPPSSCDWTHVVGSWPMYLNDTIDDCTAAAVGHLVNALSANANPRAPIVMRAAQVLRLYEQTSGYVPGNPATDDGTTCLKVLRHWLTDGVPVPNESADRISAL
jgi:hypothetical protein